MIAGADGTRSSGLLSAPGEPLAVSLAEDPAVSIVFTGRESGNLSLRVGGGDVAAARAQALSLAGSAPDRAVFMEQVHGGSVAEVGATDGGRGVDSVHGAVPGVDALLTRDTDVALAVLVADCVPIVLADAGSGVAVVHAGRRGLMHGIIDASLQRLAPRAPEQVVAVVGPAIGGCCYEVPSAMVATVASQWPVAATTTSWGTPSLDLPATARAQLAAAGVHRVHSVGSCTRCHRDRWFSHRGVGAGADPGRQAGIVVRRSAGAATPAAAATTRSLEST